MKVTAVEAANSGQGREQRLPEHLQCVKLLVRASSMQGGSQKSGSRCRNGFIRGCLTGQGVLDGDVACGHIQRVVLQHVLLRQLNARWFDAGVTVRAMEAVSQGPWGRVPG